MEKKHGILAAVIVALLAGAGWALWSGEDAELSEAKRLRDEMLNNRDSMSEEQRRAARDNFRQQAESLSEAQRRELGDGFRRNRMQRVDELLAMPKEQQIQEIDKLIQRMEERQKDRGDGEGRPDRGGDQSAGARDQRRKQGLDRTTPGQRAKMDQMKDLINDRRGELGMEPIRGGRLRMGPPR